MGIKNKSKRKATNDKPNQLKPEKSVNFAEHTIDNKSEEPPKKKIKKQKVDIVIRPSQLPTEEEIAECSKTENIKSTESKRKNKKVKHEKLINEQKIQNQLAIQQKNLNYLSLWKHNRNEWKFNKVQQVWLQKHMFDTNLIPDNLFEILIEYFSNAKGHVRQTIVKECTETIQKAEVQEEIEDEEEKIKYKRARNMLQYIND